MLIHTVFQHLTNKEPKSLKIDIIIFIIAEV